MSKDLDDLCKELAPGEHKALCPECGSEDLEFWEHGFSNKYFVKDFVVTEHEEDKNAGLKFKSLTVRYDETPVETEAFGSAEREVHCRSCGTTLYPDDYDCFPESLEDRLESIYNKLKNLYENDKVNKKMRKKFMNLILAGQI